MDPICAAARATTERQGAAFDAAIAGLPDEALNWRPGPDTNALAVLVVHAWGSARMWTARASGRDVTRDRAAEFLAAPTGDELRAVLAGALADVRARPSRRSTPRRSGRRRMGDWTVSGSRGRAASSMPSNTRRSTWARSS